jgi:hypothetical protein
MAYRIECHLCQYETWAGNIVDLLEGHTDPGGRLLCARCGATDTSIHTITGLREKEPNEDWDGYIKGVIRLTPNSSLYSPYVFLTATSPGGEVSGILFSYYKEPGPNGRLTNGPGPGGAPALTPAELVQLLEKLSAFGGIAVRESVPA